jgi:hypothetical protein
MSIRHKPVSKIIQKRNIDHVNLQTKALNDSLGNVTLRIL